MDRRTVVSLPLHDAIRRVVDISQQTASWQCRDLDEDAVTQGAYSRKASGAAAQQGAATLAAASRLRARHYSRMRPMLLPGARSRLDLNAEPLGRCLDPAPSTWLKRAIALRTWLASLSGSFRSLGNANRCAGMLFRLRVLTVAMLNLLERKSSLPSKRREAKKPPIDFNATNAVDTRA
jgi:hypothetical protein